MHSAEKSSARLRLSLTYLGATIAGGGVTSSSAARRSVNRVSGRSLAANRCRGGGSVLVSSCSRRSMRTEQQEKEKQEKLRHCCIPQLKLKLWMERHYNHNPSLVR